MTDTTDGFEIAERDLQLRGPGDFFGTRQAGPLPHRCRAGDLARATRRPARAAPTSERARRRAWSERFG